MKFYNLALALVLSFTAIHSFAEPVLSTSEAETAVDPAVSLGLVLLHLPSSGLATRSHYKLFNPTSTPIDSIQFQLKGPHHLKLNAKGCSSLPPQSSCVLSISHKNNDINERPSRLDILFGPGSKPLRLSTQIN